MAVSLAGITLLFVMTFVLHVFQVRLLVIVCGLGLIGSVLQLWPKMRFLAIPFDKQLFANRLFSPPR